MWTNRRFPPALLIFHKKCLMTVIFVIKRTTTTTTTNDYSNNGNKNNNNTGTMFPLFIYFTQIKNNILIEFVYESDAFVCQSLLRGNVPLTSSCRRSEKLVSFRLFRVEQFMSNTKLSGFFLFKINKTAILYSIRHTEEYGN